MRLPHCVRYWWQRRVRGWDDSDTWSLSSTIATFTLPRLKRLVELNNGYPGDMTKKQWDLMLLDMIYALEVCEREADGIVADADWDRVNKGLRDFGERFRDLWW